MIPIMLGCYFLLPKQSEVAVVVFLMAGLTDWLDGWVARYTNNITQLGTFLDPVADKMMTVTASMMVVVRCQDVFLVSSLFIIVLREVFMLGLREWTANIRLSHITKVARLAKFKTFLQFVSLAGVMLYAQGDGQVPIYLIGMLAVTATFSLITLLQYLIRVWPHLTAVSDGG